MSEFKFLSNSLYKNRNFRILPLSDEDNTKYHSVDFNANNKKSLQTQIIKSKQEDQIVPIFIKKMNPKIIILNSVKSPKTRNKSVNIVIQSNTLEPTNRIDPNKFIIRIKKDLFKENQFKLIPLKQNSLTRKPNLITSFKHYEVPRINHKVSASCVMENFYKNLKKSVKLSNVDNIHLENKNVFSLPKVRNSFQINHKLSKFEIKSNKYFGDKYNPQNYDLNLLNSMVRRNDFGSKFQH